MSEFPLISIVIAGRNDNYGGDFIARLQRGIDWNSSLLEKNRIHAEFVLVNWNPLKEHAELKDLIRWPSEHEYVSYRVVEVSPELHKKLLDQNLRDPVPMFEFLAKNAGVRRAKGEYVLCINADILIHSSIYRFIAAGKLKQTHYYRANRLDFESSSATSESELIQAGSFVSLKGRMYEFNQRANKELQYQQFRIRNSLWLKWELWKVKNSGFCNRHGLSVTYDNGPFVAHCLNSGDFMLMHRSHWHRLKGYAEYVFSAVHADSIFTILAYSRVTEKVFDRPILHQQHERRYSWEDMANDERFAQTYQLLKDVAKAVRENESIDKFLNDDDWGLSCHELPEFILNGQSNE